MRKAECIGIELCIESGSQKMLDSTHKGSTAQQAKLYSKVFRAGFALPQARILANIRFKLISVAWCRNQSNA
jgi:radical SAM superfamily enzyme YgiQ (UPF0313 family)